LIHALGIGVSESLSKHWWFKLTQDMQERKTVEDQVLTSRSNSFWSRGPTVKYTLPYQLRALKMTITTKFIEITCKSEGEVTVANDNCFSQSQAWDWHIYAPSHIEQVHRDQVVSTSMSTFCSPMHLLTHKIIQNSHISQESRHRG
jgi:hypothetical protein